MKCVFCFVPNNVAKVCMFLVLFVFSKLTLLSNNNERFMKQSFIKIMNFIEKNSKILKIHKNQSDLNEYFKRDKHLRYHHQNFTYPSKGN